MSNAKKIKTSRSETFQELAENQVEVRFDVIEKEHEMPI